MSKCEIFAHGGQISILLDCEGVASVPTQHMPKNTCMTHRKPFFMHDFHSMPRVGAPTFKVLSFGNSAVFVEACKRSCDTK